MNDKLDWPRIRHLYKVGILGALMAVAGDMLLGWGVYDDALTGFDRYLSRYLATPDINIFLAGVLGMLGITIEALSCFAIYRLISDARTAHAYRGGLIGVSIFGACGCHVPLCAAVYFLKKLTEADVPDAMAIIRSYFLWLVLPATLLFLIAYIAMVAMQIKAFAKGLTPYSARCWVFTPLAGFVFNALLALMGNRAPVNGLRTAYLGLGFLWMFAGLLAASGKLAKRA